MVCRPTSSRDRLGRLAVALLFAWSIPFSGAVTVAHAGGAGVDDHVHDVAVHHGRGAKIPGGDECSGDGLHDACRTLVRGELLAPDDVGTVSRPEPRRSARSRSKRLGRRWAAGGDQRPRGPPPAA